MTPAATGPRVTGPSPATVPQMSTGPEQQTEPRTGTFDVFERLRGPATKTHDVLLVDVDHSPDSRLGESSDSFYAHSGLILAAQHLNPGGVFGVWSTSENPAFEAELRKTFEEVRVEPIEFFNETIGRQETNWLFLAKMESILRR